MRHQVANFITAVLVVELSLQNPYLNQELAMIFYFQINVTFPRLRDFMKCVTQFSRFFRYAYSKTAWVT